jgi:serine protease Do
MRLVRRSASMIGCAGLFAASTVAALPGAGIAATADGAQAMGSFADMIARAEPAVASVLVAKTPTDPATAGAPLTTTPSMPTVDGSAFFVSSDGYLITAKHVVDHAVAVEIAAAGGKIYPAAVVGVDTESDLAVLKIQGDGDFAYLQFAPQMPRAGDWVIALGNPYGIGATATAGIVSAVGRDLGDGTYNTYVQIDAPLNIGNSGGPALDVHGNVVGVNDAIFAPDGGSIGIGFAIPSETASTVVAAIRTMGYVARAWLGVQLLPSALAENAGGAFVADPVSDGPAARAGIAKGDIITAINGTAIKDGRGLTLSLSQFMPGTDIELGLIHRGMMRTVSVTLGEAPAH